MAKKIDQFGDASKLDLQFGDATTLDFNFDVKKKDGAFLGETQVETDALAKQSRLSFDSPEYVSESTIKPKNTNEINDLLSEGKITPNQAIELEYQTKGYLSPSEKIKKLTAYKDFMGTDLTEEKLMNEASNLGLLYDKENKKIQFLPNDIKLYEDIFKRYKKEEEKPTIYQEILNKVDLGMKRTGQSLLELTASPLTALGIGEKTVYEGRDAIALTTPESRYEGISIQDQIKSGDVGGALGNAISGAFEQLPNLLMSTSSGGLVVQGLMAGQDKIMELKDTDIPEYKKLLNALGSFTTTYLSEKLVTAPIMENTTRTIANLGEPQARSILNNSFKQTVTNFFKNTNGTLTDIALESASEGAAQFADNAITKALVDPNKDLGDGVFDAMAVASVTVLGMKSPIVAAKGKETIKNISSKIISSMPEMPLDMKINTGNLILKKKVIEDNFKNVDPVFSDANKGELTNIDNAIKLSIQPTTVRHEINILNKELNQELSSNYPDVIKIGKLEDAINNINDSVKIDDVNLNKLNREIKVLKGEYNKLYESNNSGAELQLKSEKETSLKTQLQEKFTQRAELLKTPYIKSDQEIVDTEKTNKIKFDQKSKTIVSKIQNELNSKYPNVAKISDYQNNLTSLKNNLDIQTDEKLDSEIQNLITEYKNAYDDGDTGIELQNKIIKERATQNSLKNAYVKKQEILKPIYKEGLSISDDIVSTAFEKQSQEEAITNLKNQNLITTDYGKENEKRANANVGQGKIDERQLEISENVGIKEELRGEEVLIPTEEMANVGETVTSPINPEITETTQPKEQIKIDENSTIDDITNANKALPEDQKEVLVKNGLTIFPIDFGKKLFIKYIRPNGFTPNTIVEARTGQKGALNAVIRDVEFTRKDFNTLVKDTYGKNGIPKDVRINMDKALKQLGTDVNYQKLVLDEFNVPDVFRNSLVQMRNNIDALSNKLKEIGWIQGGLEASINNNIGFYLNRSYRLFTDPKYTYESVDPETLNKVSLVVRDSFPEFTDSQVEGYIRNLMDVEKNTYTKFLSGKLSQSDLGALKQRKEVSEVFRALYGEYTDPLYNYSNSMLKIATIIEKSKADQKIVSEGLNKFIFEKPEGNFIKEVVFNKKTYYTNADIADSIEIQRSDKNSLGGLMRAYFFTQNVVSMGKTVFSPATHSVNYLSNYALQIAAGRNIFSPSTLEAHKAIFQDLFSTDKKISREKIKNLISLNVIGDGAYSGRFIEDMKNSYKNFEQFQYDKKNKFSYRNVNDLFEKAYNAEDSVHRILAFEVEKKNYTKVFKAKNPNLSNVDIEKMAEEKAAQLVNRLMPTFSKVPEGIKVISRTPFFGQFVPYNAELLRTTGNLAQQIKEELKDKDTRSIGLTRLAGVLTVTAVPAAILYFTRLISGVDKEESKDAKKFVAEFYKNSDLAFWRSKEGNIKFIDTGRLNAYNYFIKISNAFLQGKDYKDGIQEATKEAFSGFVAPEILALTLKDLYENKGYNIYNPEEDQQKISLDITKFLANRLSPGIITTGLKIYYGATDQVSKGGKKYEVSNELLTLIGLRTTTLDINQTFKFKLNEYSDILGNTLDIYKKTIYNEKITPEEQEKAYNEATEAFDKRILELNDYYQSAIRLNVDFLQLNRSLKSTKIGDYKASKKVVNGIKYGITPIISAIDGNIQ